MPKKKKKQARAGAQRAKPKKSPGPAHATEQIPVAAPPAGTDMAAAAQRFTSDLLIRGEAAKLDKKGKLPRNATHVIKKQQADGSAELERVRFKTF
jgi:hypothetical protein